MLLNVICFFITGIMYKQSKSSSQSNYPFGIVSVAYVSGIIVSVEL